MSDLDLKPTGVVVSASGTLETEAAASVSVVNVGEKPNATTHQESAKAKPETSTASIRIEVANDSDGAIQLSIRRGDTLEANGTSYVVTSNYKLDMEPFERSSLVIDVRSSAG